MTAAKMADYLARHSFIPDPSTRAAALAIAIIFERTAQPVPVHRVAKVIGRAESTTTGYLRTLTKYGLVRHEQGGWFIPTPPNC